MYPFHEMKTIFLHFKKHQANLLCESLIVKLTHKELKIF
jgi:hypothetical protein